MVDGKKPVVRKRPSICITLNDALLKEIDEIAYRLHLTRSEVIERCLLLGLPKMQIREQKTENTAKSSSDEDTWKKILFDMEHAELYGWRPV